MENKIILHIGTHKTGSTTVQNYLEMVRPKLIQFNMHFFEGSFIRSNHIELYLSCLDRQRDSLALKSMKIGSLDELFNKTQHAIRKALAAHESGTAIFSTEGLSLLRTPKEYRRLVDLFGHEAYDVKVVCVLREKADYLEAYRNQILKVPGRKPSLNPESSLYVESDSWLADFDGLIAGYKSIFGQKSISLIDYDAEVTEHGDVLPAVLREMEVPESLIPAPGSVQRVNTSSMVNRLRLRMHKIRSLCLKSV